MFDSHPVSGYDPWTIVELYRQHASMEQCRGELSCEVQHNNSPWFLQKKKSPYWGS